MSLPIVPVLVLFGSIMCVTLSARAASVGLDYLAPTGTQQKPVTDRPVPKPQGLDNNIPFEKLLYMDLYETDYYGDLDFGAGLNPASGEDEVSPPEPGNKLIPLLFD